MNPRRLLIGLLLLATVVVDGVALVVVGGRFQQLRWPQVTLGAFFSLPFSQVSLASIWAGLARTPAPGRLLGAFMTAMAWAVLLDLTLRHNAVAQYNRTRWIALLLMQVLFVLGPLSIVRATGVRLTESPGPRPAKTHAVGAVPVQFSLGYLLGWITAVAIVLGMVRWGVSYELLPRSPSAWAETAVLGLTHGCVALLSLWLLLGSLRHPLEFAMLCYVTMSALAACFLLAAEPGYEAALAALFCAETLLLVGPLWVLRVAGYRLKVRRDR